MQPTPTLAAADPLAGFAAEAQRLCTAGSLPTATASVAGQHFPATALGAAFSTYRATVYDTAFVSSENPLGLHLFSTSSTHQTPEQALAELAAWLGIPLRRYAVVAEVFHVALPTAA